MKKYLILLVLLVSHSAMSESEVNNPRYCYGEQVNLYNNSYTKKTRWKHVNLHLDDGIEIGEYVKSCSPGNYSGGNISIQGKSYFYQGNPNKSIEIRTIGNGRININASILTGNIKIYADEDSEIEINSSLIHADGEILIYATKGAKIKISNGSVVRGDIQLIASGEPKSFIQPNIEISKESIIMGNNIKVQVEDKQSFKQSDNFVLYDNSRTINEGNYRENNINDFGKKTLFLKDNLLRVQTTTHLLDIWELNNQMMMKFNLEHMEGCAFVNTNVSPTKYISFFYDFTFRYTEIDDGDFYKVDAAVLEIGNDQSKWELLFKKMELNKFKRFKQTVDKLYHLCNKHE